MTRTIPGHVHSFELTKVTSSAVTYHLRPSQKARDGLAYHVGGWALATVNDATGELAIQSDWGNWSYRWNTHHLGARGTEQRRSTLTEFIGERDACHYIADKLTSREERDRFDADKTVREMRRILIERRVEAAREWIDYYRCDGDEAPDVLDEPPSWAEGGKVWIHGRDERWPLSKAITRSLYESVGELSGDDERDFVEGFLRIEGHALITEEPWEHTRHSPSSAYEQLLHGILPALVEACRQRVGEATTPTENPQAAGGSR